jgi:hypothetical protein
MRIKEFINENWWKDLDPGALGMMGYTSEIPAAENNEDLASQVAQDAKSIQGKRQR